MSAGSKAYTCRELASLDLPIRSTRFRTASSVSARRLRTTVVAMRSLRDGVDDDDGVGTAVEGLAAEGLAVDAGADGSRGGTAAGVAVFDRDVVPAPYEAQEK